VIRGPAGSADRLQFKVTVEDGARRHSITVGEASMPRPIAEIVRLVASG
jgi:hypothetical protein